MSTAHPMVEKAARAWCKRHAEACGLDEATLWAEREAGFLTEAQAALEACGALELLALAEQYADECASCGEPPVSGRALRTRRTPSMSNAPIASTSGW